MANIIPFQQRSNDAAERRDAATDATSGDNGGGSARRTATPARSPRRDGQVVLFTGVRYCRWEDGATSGADLQPAE